MKNLDKELIIGVDWGDDMSRANMQGEIGDTPLVRQIMENIKEAGATAVCWRVTGIGAAYYPSEVYHTWYPKSPITRMTIRELVFKRCDPLRVAVDYAHELGLKIYIYLTLFDDAFEDMETMFGHRHPEYYMRHYGEKNQYRDPLSYCVKGVFSYGYPEVRAWRMELVDEIVSYGADAIYLDCARTHSGANPIPVHGWFPGARTPHIRYGYNDYEIARYREQYGEEPPVRSPTDLSSPEPTEDEINWNQVRGSFLTEFMREASSAVRSSDQKLCVCFFPKTYNGFNPGYQCRQMLGWFDVAWEQWVDEKLIDEIRLNVDHRKFGYDDWTANSRNTYRKAQDAGVKVFIDCALDYTYDRMANPPVALPVTREKMGDDFYKLQEDMTLKMLQTSADGVFFYEHCGTDSPTFEAIRSARQRYQEDS